MTKTEYGPTVGGAWGILASVLASFTLLAFVSREYIPSPKSLRHILVPQMNEDGSSDDFFLSARSSASTMTLALSFFASGMGAWVVYGTTEMGANPKLSWLGVIGYSSASAFPALIICLLGPKVRRMTGENAFGTTDFARQRYGRLMQLAVAGISIFYMFIFIVAELTSISNIYALLVGKDIGIPAAPLEKGYTTSISWTVAAATVFYTAVAGVPASIVTDKFQGVMMVCLVIILVIAISVEPSNQPSLDQFHKASNWTADGFVAAVTLILAVCSAEMFNQGNWQRVWAAKDEKTMVKGFAIGSAMVFFLMMFFGVMGMISYAVDPNSFGTYAKFAYLSFFYLLIPIPTAVNYLVLVLVTALAASSIDTLQNAIISVFSRDILSIPKCQVKLNIPTKPTLGAVTTRVLVMAINVPAVFMASQRFDVITLFLVADLVCATAVLPVFLGLITEKHLYGIFTPITELGGLLGIVSGVSAVLINGAILNFTEAVNMWGEVLATGPFSYFWLTNGSICALCGTKTMITFIVTPIAGGVGALLFTHLDILIRGEEEARKPLFGAFWRKMEAKAGIAEVEKPKYKFVNAAKKDNKVPETVSGEDSENSEIEVEINAI